MLSRRLRAQLASAVHVQMKEADMASAFVRDLVMTVAPLGGDASRVLVTDLRVLPNDTATTISFSVSKFHTVNKGLGKC